MNQQITLTRQAIKTPRAAAVAGIIFAVLFTTSIVLMRLSRALLFQPLSSIFRNAQLKEELTYRK